MGCREKRLSREEGPKKKRCQKIRTPIGRDVSGKRLKKHRFQKTAMTSKNQFQERRVCQVSGFRAVSMKGCKDSEMSGASRIKRKWQHQAICRGQNMSRTKGFKRSRSQRRASQAAASYTLSLFFSLLPPRNFRHPAARALFTTTWRSNRAVFAPMCMDIMDWAASATFPKGRVRQFRTQADNINPHDVTR